MVSGPRQQQSYVRVQERLRGLDREMVNVARDTDRAGHAMERTERSMTRLNASTDKGNKFLAIFRSQMGLIAVGATALLPLISRLAGGITTLVGSLVQAAGGAGVIGGGALGAFAAGLGSVFAVVKTMTSAMKPAQQAFAAYNKAVAEYGAQSKQAATAQRNLNAALKDAPAGTLQLLSSVKSLKKEWQDATKAAQGYLVQTANYAIAGVRGVMPQVAGVVNQNVNAFAGAARGLIDKLLSPESLRIFTQLSAGFRRDLPPAVDALENLVMSMGRLFVAAQPFTTKFIDRFDKWTKQLDAATHDTDWLHDRMHAMVVEFDRWVKLLESAGKMLWTLFRAATNAQNATGGMTAQFDKWTRWMQDNPLKMQKFFDQSAQGMQDIGKALLWVVQLFGRLSTALDPLWQNLRPILGGMSGPLLQALTTLAKTISLISQGLGPLGGTLTITLRLVNRIFTVVNWLLEHVPGLASLFGFALIAVGLRRMWVGMQNFITKIIEAIGRMTGLAAETNAAAGAVERLAFASRGVGGVGGFGGPILRQGERMTSGGVILPPGVGREAQQGGRLARFLGRVPLLRRLPFLGRAAPVVAEGATAASILEGVPGIRSVATQATRGGLLSRLPMLGRLFGGAGAAGGMATAGRLASVGRLASPIGWATLLGTTALSMVPSRYMPGGSTTTGLLSSTATGAGLGAMVGSVVPGIGTGIGAAVGGGLGLGFGLFSRFHRPHEDTQMRALQERAQRDQAAMTRLGGEGAHTTRQIQGQLRILRRERRMLIGDESDTAKAVRDQINQQIQMRQQVLPGIRTQERHQQRTAAFNLETQLGRGYNIISAAKGPMAAMDWVRREVLKRWSKLGPAGKDEMAKGVTKWAEEMKKAVPTLGGEVDKIKQSIIGKWDDMHQTMLAHSQKHWNDIAKAMQTPVEQAREAITTKLTQIQQQAIDSLGRLGFTPQRAQALVSAMERGGSAAATASTIVTRTQQGQYGPVPGEGAVYDRHHHARGGRLTGYGLSDTVPIGGDRGAPGELVVNRHTEARINRMLMGRTTLGAQVAGEGRPHGYARGGRLTVDPGVDVRDVSATLMNHIRALSQVHPVTITSGYRSVAKQAGLYARYVASGFNNRYIAAKPGQSAHNFGLAVDALINGAAAGSSGINLREFGLVAPVAGDPVHLELAGNSPQLLGLSAAMTRKGAVAGTAGGGGARGTGGGGAVPQLGMSDLLPELSGIGGLPGLMVDATGLLIAGGMTQRLNAALRANSRAQGRAGKAARHAYGVGSNAAMKLGRQMAAAKGWTGSQWAALQQLWMGESGWNPQAKNPSSGAFGIPQALPASKMGPAAVAGDAAAQITWGMNYIAGRYGTPGQALSTWQARSPHWYGEGGHFIARRPQLIGVGDRGAEEVTVRPVRGRGGAGGHGINVVVHIGRIDATGSPGSIRDMVRGEIRDAIADVAEELDRTGMVMG